MKYQLLTIVDTTTTATAISMPLAGSDTGRPKRIIRHLISDKPAQLERNRVARIVPGRPHPRLDQAAAGRGARLTSGDFVAAAQRARVARKTLYRRT